MEAFNPLESLTKENFWNEIQEKYPLAMKLFSEWIDEYKVKIGWDSLFNGGIAIPQNDVRLRDTHVETVAPKFHNLPYDMQFGIISRFGMEMFADGKLKDYYKSPIDSMSYLRWDVKYRLSHLFEEIELAERKKRQLSRHPYPL